MVLLIDNYDSFTYNLAQYLGELGAEVRVPRNDAIVGGRRCRDAARRTSSSRPGPGRPEDAGIVGRRHPARSPRRCRSWACASATRRSGWRSGATSCARQRRCTARCRWSSTMGGASSAGLTAPFAAARYHSLVVAARRLRRRTWRSRLASAAKPTVMALRHRSWPMHGVQFHPESVLTTDGRVLLRNFLEL